MTVKELIEYLQEYSEDMEIVHYEDVEHSVYCWKMDKKSFRVFKLVDTKEDILLYNPDNDSRINGALKSLHIEKCPW